MNLDQLIKNEELRKQLETILNTYEFQKHQVSILLKLIHELSQAIQFEEFQNNEETQKLCIHLKSIIIRNLREITGRTNLQ